ncbi:MAG: NUDIX hydrolase [Lachnospiraceae bacterium]|nr:NUDIX hydrolase [Lachnospiraceae bacterium]
MNHEQDRRELRDANGLTEAEFLKQYNSDIYPKPSLTADVVIFRIHDDDRDPDVLLIRRKGHPFLGHLALPGGFAEMGETIETTAERELEEETGVTGMEIKLVGVYSRLGRDPRGWTVTAAYTTTVKDGEIRPVAGDDAGEVCWASVRMQGDENGGELTVSVDGKCVNDELAFDHHEIITDAYRIAALD